MEELRIIKVTGASRLEAETDLAALCGQLVNGFRVCQVEYCESLHREEGGVWVSRCIVLAVPEKAA